MASNSIKKKIATELYHFELVNPNKSDTETQEKAAKLIEELIAKYKLSISDLFEIDELIQEKLDNK